MKMDGNGLITVSGLSKFYQGRGSFLGEGKKILRAVDGVSFSIREGETLGLVGESGCGKSTLGRIILRLIPASGGSVRYQGEELLDMPKKALRGMRRRMQIVFQDPYASLNPRMTVEEIVTAPLAVFKIGIKTERREAAARVLEEVGLSSRHLGRFPHEFSGGQRQRIGIARSLVLNPEFVVFDEPLSALDVSVRAQVLNLIRSLQNRRKLTSLFISHDLSVVKHISDRIAVMYLGKLLELADKHELYNHPLHPYTRGLIGAIPIPDTGRRRKRTELPGDVPSAYHIPQGCRFHTRCSMIREVCTVSEPELRQISAGHWAACHQILEQPRYPGST
ncbi:MAG: ATP-binding cassette domain-containing protein [Treponema sp.]|jgi:peptide/nickel transport system ATP-binding protein/oligopeptide transport system ATP-binding protein|nr:ATP-binding cassette domain-containing protein [Treponema sp.]